MTEPMTDERLAKIRTFQDLLRLRPRAVEYSNRLILRLCDDVLRCDARIRELEAEGARNHERIATMIAELERWRKRVWELVHQAAPTARANNPNCPTGNPHDQTDDG